MFNTITVRIPKRLQSQLQLISHEEKVPMNDLVLDSLRRYLAVHQFRRLRAKVLPFAKVQALLTDKDVFKIVS